MAAGNTGAAQMVLEMVGAEIEKKMAKVESGYKEDAVKHHNAIMEEMKQIREQGGVSTSLVKELKALEARHDQLAADFKGEFMSGFEKLTERLGQLEKENARLPISGGGDQYKTIGELYTESKSYQAYKEAGWTGPGQKVDLQSVSAHSLDKVQLMKSLSGTDALRSVFSTERMTEIFRDPIRPERIRDLFPIVRTTANSVEFLQENVTFSSTSGWTGNLAAGVSEGGLKPESSLGYSSVTVPIRTIAHWMPVTNQMLEDIPMLRGMIDQRLVEGLWLKEDIQLLYGTGVDPDITGLLTNALIKVQNQTDGAIGDTIIDTVRRGILKARLGFYPVTGLVMNPINWADAELTKGNDGHYLFLSFPNGNVTPTIWRVPVTETTAIAVNTYVCGAFRMGTILFDRAEASVRATDTHSDYFIYNKTVVLAEMREGLGVVRPSSIVRGNFDRAPVWLS